MKLLKIYNVIGLYKKKTTISLKFSIKLKCESAFLAIIKKLSQKTQLHSSEKSNLVKGHCNNKVF